METTGNSQPKPASSIININSTSSPVSNGTTPINTDEKLITIGSLFQYQALLTMSFGVFMELVTISYQQVDGIIFPQTLFKSNPALFQVFVILNCFTFSASVIGLWLEGKYKKFNMYLWLFAFSTFMISIYIYIGNLLPSFLQFIPYTLLLAIFLVLLYVIKNKHTEKVSSNGDTPIILSIEGTAVS